jgi:hypothetical protein
VAQLQFSKYLPVRFHAIADASVSRSATVGAFSPRRIRAVN